MSALRTFKAFTNAAPVSPLVLIDGLGTTTMALKFPVTLVNLDGYAAAAGWFQIFDLAVAPTTGTTVPMKSINVAAAGNLSSLLSSIGPIEFNKGLYLAMSSTEAVYTAVSTNFDVWGEVEEWEGIQLSGTNVVGDLTSSVDHLVIRTEAQGPKQLVGFDIIPNSLTGTRYIMLFATDTPTNGSKPLAQWTFVNGSVQQTFRFGATYPGIITTAQDANYIQRKGINLYLSDTTGVLTYSGGGGASGDTVNLRAFWQ